MSLPLDGNAAQRLRANRLETVLIEHPHPEFSAVLLTTAPAASWRRGTYSKKGTAAARMFISGRTGLCDPSRN